MKYLLILIILATNSFGQIQFEPNPRIFKLLSKNLQVSEVIDLRNKKDIFLYSLDSTQVIETKSSLDTLLFNFFKQSIESSNNTSKLFITINEFQFGYRKKEGFNLVSIYCDLDIYRKTEDGYQLVNTFNECIEGKGTSDITKLLRLIHWQFWNNIFIETEKKLEYRLKNDIIQLDEIKSAKQVPEIFKSSFDSDGLYPFFDDFLNAKIQSPDFDLIEKTNGYEIVNYKGQKIDNKINIWGLRKFNTLFLCLKRDYFSDYTLIPLILSGNTVEVMEDPGYELINKIKTDKSKVSAMENVATNIASYSISGSQMAGTSIIASLISLGVEHIKNTKEINKYLINLKTGQPYRVIIYRYK